MTNKLPPLLLTLLIVPILALANSPAARGLEIAKARKAADQGWGSSQSQSLMILRNKQGKESRRQLRNKSLEITDDGDKSLTLFDSPKDIQGTVFLSFSHNDKNDQQWLYLPALKRVKKISSRNKSGPFMGSEFAYEDLSSFEIDKFNFKWLRDHPCGEHQCYVVQSVPTDRYSGYSKIITWLDHDFYRVHKIEFYDRKQSHLKTLVTSEFKLYQEKFWRSHHAMMTNHLTGKSTELRLSNFKFNTGLTSKDFNKNALKRAR